MRYSFVKLLTLNLALLRKQPKFCKDPAFPFILLFYFIYLFFWFNFTIFKILGLFDFCVKCFKCIQKDKDNVDLIRTEFLGVD